MLLSHHLHKGGGAVKTPKASMQLPPLPHAVVPIVAGPTPASSKDGGVVVQPVHVTVEPSESKDVVPEAESKDSPPADGEAEQKGMEGGDVGVSALEAAGGSSSRGVEGSDDDTDWASDGSYEYQSDAEAADEAANAFANSLVDTHIDHSEDLPPSLPAPMLRQVSYEVMDATQLAQERQREMGVVAAVLQVPLHSAGLLLSHVKWNVEELVQRFVTDEAALCEAAGVPDTSVHTRASSTWRRVCLPSRWLPRALH